MKKQWKITLLAAAFSLLACFSVFAAADWEKNADGTYWHGLNEDNTERCTNGWYWIQNMAEFKYMTCYYFDENGNLLTNTTTPDGSQVNALGQWTENGAAIRIEAPPGSAGVIRADFDYTPYIMDKVSGIRKNELNGYQRQRYLSYLLKLEKMLDGTAHRVKTGANNSVTIDIWYSDVNANDIETMKQSLATTEGVQKVWKEAKETYRNLALGYYREAFVNILPIDVFLNVVTGDTQEKYLSFVNARCTYDAIAGPMY